MATLRACGILVLFLAVTLVLAPLQWLVLKLRLPARDGIPHFWNRAVRAILGIRVSVTGESPRKGALIAANHASWIDIPALSAVGPLSFVAKSDIERWPMFGWLAGLQRTVFVERERAKTGEARDEIRERLMAGDTLVLFPEGTSSDGNRVLGFKSSLLGAAELALGEDAGRRERHAAVQPVSIAYVGLHGVPMGRENRPFCAWYGDMELVPHLWEMFKTGPVDVVVELHKPLTIDEAGDRKALAKRVEDLVRAGVIRALAGAHKAPTPPAQDEDLIAALRDADPAEAA